LLEQQPLLQVLQVRLVQQVRLQGPVRLSKWKKQLTTPLHR
jgi:hypothetical protein